MFNLDWNYCASLIEHLYGGDNKQPHGSVGAPVAGRDVCLQNVPAVLSCFAACQELNSL